MTSPRITGARLWRAARRALLAVVSGVLLACAHPGIGLAQGVVSYSEPTGMVSVGVGGQASNTVSCPSGAVVLGGGYYQPLTDIYITESAPANASGTGWTIGVNNLTGEAVTVNIYAVCAQAPASYSVQSASCAGTSSCSITCPGAASVTGGGYSYSGAITAEGSFPTKSNQWSLLYSESSGSISIDAVCAQAPDGYVQESGNSGSSGLVNVACPGGTVVLGGGGSEGVFPSQNPGWNAPIAFGPTLESTQWSFGAGYSGAPTGASGFAICAQEQPLPPTVTGVSPASGPVAGGTSVTIAGTNLTGASAVTFGTAGAAKSFTVDSGTQITAVSPAAKAGAVDITVSTAGGTSATSAADKFTFAVAPTIFVSCSPATVEVATATQCTATATNPGGSGASMPTGTVKLTSDSSGSFGSSGACTLAGSGASASCGLAYTPLARGSGTHTITAAYAGDATHAAGTAKTAVTVVLRPTRGSVACSPSSVTVAATSVCDVTVTDTGGSGATAPTGAVTFASSGQGAFTGSGQCTLAAASAGAAGCAVSYTPSVVGSGAHGISASYGGDAVHSAASAAAQVDVAPASVPAPPGPPGPSSSGTVSLAVSCSPSVVTPQQQTVCTVTATAPAGSSAAPTGQVVLASPDGRFANGGYCVLAPVGHASAGCSLVFTATGTGTIRITASLGAGGAQASTTVATPPTAGRTAAVTATGGTVLIKIGGKFVPLAQGAVLVATGATIDVRKGEVTLTTAADGLPATNPAHHLSNATLSAGIFTIEQQQAAQHAAGQPTPTDVLLVTPPKAIAAARCTRPGPPSKGVVRMLHGVVKGVYRIHAGASTLSINNGTFTVQDRCDGTLTKITKGRARVTITKGPRRHHQVTLSAGQSLLVQAEQFSAKQIAARHHPHAARRRLARSVRQLAVGALEHGREDLGGGASSSGGRSPHRRSVISVTAARTRACSSTKFCGAKQYAFQTSTPTRSRHRQTCQGLPDRHRDTPPVRIGSRRPERLGL